MSRDLQRENPANVELRAAVGLALAGRADAYAGFARAPSSRTRAADLEAAERDYAESVEIYQALRQGRVDRGDRSGNAREQSQGARGGAQRARGVQIPNPKLQIPTTPNTQIPIKLQTGLKLGLGIWEWLGVGIWEWLGFGAWDLGFDDGVNRSSDPGATPDR